MTHDDAPELWVHPPTGRVYRLSGSAWPLLRGRELRLRTPDGRERPVRAGRLPRFLLAPAEGVQALLADETVRTALLDSLEAATPHDGRWLLDAARARTPEALLEALRGSGEDPGRLLVSFGQVLRQLGEAGGPDRLAEVAGEAVRQVSPQAQGRGEPLSLPLELLGSALGRLAREDPDGLRAALMREEPPEDVYASTRAHVAAGLNLTPPSFSYAALLGREPDQAPDAESDDEARK